MPRESRAAREGRQAVVYRYAVKGRVSEPVIAEIQRAHILRNRITECYRRADEEIAALHATSPDVAAAAAAAEQARLQVLALREEMQARKARGRTRRPDPEVADRLAAAQTQAAAARAALKEAKAAVRAAGLREEEARIWGAALTRVKGLYVEAVSGRLYAGTPVEGALYWASWNMVAGQQRTALDRLIALRKNGRRAELQFRRWDGSGTVAVHLQRKAADPPRTPASLADSEAGKWRNVALLTPGLTEAEWAALAPADRKRAELRIRVGSGDSASWKTLPIVLHRPVPDDADVAAIQVSVWRVTSTRVRGSVALTVLLPAADQRAEGPAVAIHTGWRVLNDGAIRVAVITGAGTPPPGLGMVKNAAQSRVRQRARRARTRSAVPARPWAGDTPSAPESGMRDHGTWQEIVIPAGVRDLDARARSLGAIRDRAMNEARAGITAHLARHPADQDVIDPHGSLDRWRSPHRFRRALRALEDAGEADPALVRALHKWQEQDVHLELWQSYERRRHILGWRQDLYRNVGAWLAGQAQVIVVDSWTGGRTVPDVGEEDTLQMQAARGNAALAAPGELRRTVTVAAARRGVAVHQSRQQTAGTHHGCGGDLPAEERRQHLTVTCRGCDRRVDQDLNVLAAMLATAGTAS